MREIKYHDGEFDEPLFVLFAVAVAAPAVVVVLLVVVVVGAFAPAPALGWQMVPWNQVKTVCISAGVQTASQMPAV